MYTLTLGWLLLLLLILGALGLARQAAASSRSRNTNPPPRQENRPEYGRAGDPDPPQRSDSPSNISRGQRMDFFDRILLLFEFELDSQTPLGESLVPATYCLLALQLSTLSLFRSLPLSLSLSFFFTVPAFC
ncbi:UNVERIFIED_CONTAM: hypothetical protein FKN15_031302 [Acipenser sinensis]